MPSPKMLDLLRQWQAGKNLRKAQYAELVNDGLLIQPIDADKDTYRLSAHGNIALTQNQ